MQVDLLVLLRLMTCDTYERCLVGIHRLTRPLNYSINLSTVRGTFLQGTGHQGPVTAKRSHGCAS